MTNPSDPRGNPYPFRAHGRWVLLKRVRDRSSLIVSVGETHGVDDRVLQVGEILSAGERAFEKDRDNAPSPGDLVVFNQARVQDHFRWGSEDIVVYPGEWVLGVVTGGSILVYRQDARQYDRQPL